MRAVLPKQEELKFQIAPMVDIMFILILFFMVSAGSIRVETEMSIRLPGRALLGQKLEMPDEQIVFIREDGAVSLNDEPLGAPQDREMPDLKSTLLRFKALSDATANESLVTIMSEPETKYQRVIDVLNVCAAAKIQGVTFSTTGDEGP